MSKMRMTLLLPLFALAGCAGASYCEGKQDYQRAKSVPQLQAADGLKIPDSEGTLKIPPAPASSTPFAQPEKDEDGDDVVQCLDKPPELPPPAEPAAAPDKKPA